MEGLPRSDSYRNEKCFFESIARTFGASLLIYNNSKRILYPEDEEQDIYLLIYFYEPYLPVSFC